MAKPDIRAAVAKEWLTAHDTLERISAAIRNRPLAVSTLLNRIRAGLVQTAAMSARWENIDHPVGDVPVLIPADYWRHFPKIQTVEELAFWQTGDIRFEIGMNNNFETVAVHYFGVRFEPLGIEDIIASAAAASSPPGVAPQFALPESTARGGRPRKEFWDDFWIEICGQIYEGNLKPQRQAELEKAMLDWATNHGHELSEATARKAAKRLFNAWKLGG
jgi:hypothetical protein